MANKKNKVKFGLSNVHYAKQITGEDGAISFATPVAFPGAVSLSMTAQGETNKFYADDVAYYTAVANDGYQGDLEVALIPDDFARDILGEVEDETDKVLVENSAVEGSAFAMLFEFKGDKRAIRHVLYNCTAARPAVDGETTSNTKEPKTSSLTLTASPLANGNVKAKTTADTPDKTYNNWYEKVWEPKTNTTENEASSDDQQAEA